MVDGNFTLEDSVFVVHYIGSGWKWKWMVVYLPMTLYLPLYMTSLYNNVKHAPTSQKDG